MTHCWLWPRTPKSSSAHWISGPDSRRKMGSSLSLGHVGSMWPGCSCDSVTGYRCYLAHVHSSPTSHLCSASSSQEICIMPLQKALEDCFTEPWPVRLPPCSSWPWLSPRWGHQLPLHPNLWVRLEWRQGCSSDDGSGLSVWRGARCGMKGQVKG